MWALILLLIFIAIAVSIAVDREKKQEGKMNITVSRKFSYNRGFRTYQFLIDEAHRTVYYSLGGSRLTQVPYSEIIGCEILEDSVVSGGVGRAIVGGILAGGAGAIVGATTAGNKVAKYEVVVYSSNLEKPRIVFELITDKVKKTDAQYKQAAAFAAQVDSCVRAIIALKNEEASCCQGQPNVKPETGDTPEGRLEQLRSLHFKHLITDEEYNEMRMKILNTITGGQDRRAAQYCPACGMELGEQDLFCPNCGTKVR